MHTHKHTRAHAHACMHAHVLRLQKLGLQRGPKRESRKLLCRTPKGKDIEKTNVTMDPVLDFNFGLAYVAQFHAWWGMYGCANSLRYRFGDSAWQTGDDA